MSLTSLTAAIQRHLGIPADGIYGPQTANAIISALAIPPISSKLKIENRKLKIAVDIGHSIGRVQPNKVDEHAIVEPIARETARIITTAGLPVSVIDFPDLDNAADLKKTAAAIRSGNYSHLLSIHANWDDSPSPHGACVLYHPDSPQSKALAAAIATPLCTSFPGRADHIVPRTGLAVLNAALSTGTPAALIECAFMSNPQDLHALQTNPAEFAAIIAAAFLTHLGI